MRVPSWVWLALVVVLVGGLMGVGYLGARWGQARADAHTQVALADAAATFRHYRDSVRMNTEALQAQATGDSLRVVDATARELETSLTARRERALLAGALSAADSLPRLVELVEAQDSQIAMLTVSRETYKSMISTQMALVASLRGRIVNDSTELDRRGHQPPAITPFQREMTPFRRVLRAGETVAIGAVTVTACSAHLLSIGCLAGSVVTLVRVL